MIWVPSVIALLFGSGLRSQVRGGDHHVSGLFSAQTNPNKLPELLVKSELSRSPSNGRHQLPSHRTAFHLQLDSHSSISRYLGKSATLRTPPRARLLCMFAIELVEQRRGSPPSVPNGKTRERREGTRICAWGILDIGAFLPLN